MSLGNIYNKPFSHIYVEEELMEDKSAAEILQHFSDAKIIKIHHYKDLFNRKKQDILKQHDSMALILANKKGRLIYDGSPVCQDFDHRYFYYTSLCMNCIFSCDYCYLKGLYPSGNLVIFCNINDYFSEIKELLKEHPVYLCISYDTDLCAIEELTGYVKKWCDFTRENPDLTIEIRTKSGNKKIFEKISPCDRTIFAWTMSPTPVIDAYEKKTASLAARVEAASKALEKGFPVRLCFDPMIYTNDWERDYKEIVEYISERIALKELKDISIGSFRISESYLKAMRKCEPLSAVVQYPFINQNGFYQYDESIRQKMEMTLKEMLLDYIPEDRIFFWTE